MARHPTIARPLGVGALLRLPLTLAARIEREHQRAVARMLWRRCACRLPS